MRKVLTAVMLMAALGAAPMTILAAQGTQAKPAAKPAAAKAAPSHSTNGTVKTISSDSLTITRPGKSGGDMTFTLNSSTSKTGNPEVGSKVTVRYHEEGSNKIATAVTAHPAAPAKKK